MLQVTSPLVRRALVALVLYPLAACMGTRTIADPIVVVRSAGGTELGVSTEYGLIFLGHTARAGYIEVSAWFGDGPSIEPSVIEPLGGGLYTADTEIRLPTVPLTFVEPTEGEKLLVVGRGSGGTRSFSVRVRSDPRVYGILVDLPRGLRGRGDQTGAGVFRVERGERKLLGLVSGILRLQTDRGQREFMTVVGPQDLWRLTTHRRDRERVQAPVYRPDIL